jgi:MFS family permease
MNNKLKTNINKYYLFQFFDSLAFFGPVIVLFWQSNGLNMTQIMLLQSIYSVGVVLLELPTGAFADRYGKKTSLIIGGLIWTVGLFWYGASHSFWQFAIGEITCGIGAAFVSGADRAYLHQLLLSDNQENSFKKVEGRARGIIQVAQAIASLFGGFIGSISYGWTLFATAIATFTSSLVGLTFPNTKVKLANENKPSYFQIIKESIYLVKNHQSLLWLTLFFAAFNGLLWPLNFYVQPYFKMLKIPVYLFGFIYMSFNLISAYGSTTTYWFEKKFKQKIFLIMSIIVISSLFLISIFPSIYIIPLLSLFITFVFINQTIISDYVLKIIPSDKAATVLSFQSLIRRLAYVIIGPILGMTYDIFGIRIALFSYSILLTIIFGVLLIKQKKYLAFQVSV